VRRAYGGENDEPAADHGVVPIALSERLRVTPQQIPHYAKFSDIMA
jgi:hypothetical protein